MFCLDMILIEFDGLFDMVQNDDAKHDSFFSFDDELDKGCQFQWQWRRIHVWFGDEGLTAQLSFPSGYSFEMILAVDVALGLLPSFCQWLFFHFIALTRKMNAVPRGSDA